MDFDELSGFEKIGLAFMCGFAAARSFEETEEEDEIPDIKIEKIEGKQAKKLLEILENRLNFKEGK